jgi:hypothetical protein
MSKEKSNLGNNVENVVQDNNNNNARLLFEHLILLFKFTAIFKTHSIILKISLTLVTLNPGSGPPPITYILSLIDTADNP